MKAKDLIEILKENPDFEVRVNMLIPCEKGLSLVTHEIIDLKDIGYSSEVIVLDSEEVI